MELQVGGAVANSILDRMLSPASEWLAQGLTDYSIGLTSTPTWLDWALEFSLWTGTIVTRPRGNLPRATTDGTNKPPLVLQTYSSSAGKFVVLLQMDELAQHDVAQGCSLQVQMSDLHVVCSGVVGSVSLWPQLTFFVAHHDDLGDLDGDNPPHVDSDRVQAIELSRTLRSFPMEFRKVVKATDHTNLGNLIKLRMHVVTRSGDDVVDASSDDLVGFLRYYVWLTSRHTFRREGPAFALTVLCCHLTIIHSGHTSH
ncbi:MAG: hypothetical protein Q9195_003378 [Heterodermia aff. obscurata]